LGLVIAVLGIYLLLLSPNPKLAVINNSSQQLIIRDQSEYRQGASKLFRGSWLNYSKATIDTHKIRSAMLAKYPELQDVSVTVPFFTARPTVYIVPARPALSLQASNGNFILDSRGKALIRAENVPEGSNLSVPAVTDQSNARINLNQQALSGESVRFIETVSAQLHAKQTISSLTLPSGVNELDVRVKDQPYFIKFNLADHTPREQVGTYLATIRELNRQHIVPAQYVDVRVAGRAYYQ
jgi:hypothetical protein